jgi:uncharacterized phiE125 gp8 family phage protein
MTLDRVKQNLRLSLDSHHNDAELLDLIQAATEQFEADAARACITQTFKQYQPSFGLEIQLQRRPIASVIEIAYLDQNGDPQVVDPLTYVVSTARRRIIPAYGQNWPSHTIYPDSVVVTFTAGVDETSQVPRLYQKAISLLVGNWFIDPADERARDQYKTSYHHILNRLISESQW